MKKRVLIISILVSVIIGVFIGVPLHFSLLLLPLLFVIQIIFILWVSLFLAILNVFTRDIDYIFEVLLRILFFITPIFYAKTYVSGIALLIVQLNPLTHILDFGRDIIIYGKMPNAMMLLALFSTHIVLLIIALWLFRKLEPHILEFLWWQKALS